VPDGAVTASPSKSSDEDVLFEKQHVEEDVFVRVLGESTEAIEQNNIPYAVIGGIPSSVMGRPRWTEDKADIDFFVKLQDCRKTLEALAGAGFATRELDPSWLFKGAKDGVVVDVIFRSTGDIYLDDEMIQRSIIGDFKGTSVRLIAPEDLVVMKAVAHSEVSPGYWHDAVGILGRTELDWDYLARRARQYGAHRVLSLLIFAQSNDIAVSNGVIESLFEDIYRH
jgi:predicted nucleotidyltransferase